MSPTNAAAVVSIRQVRWLAATGLMALAAVGFADSDPTPAAPPADKPVFVCPPCGCGSDSRTFEKPGECPDCRMGLVRKMPQRAPRYVAIVVFGGVELLDFAGPGEVFSAAMGSNGNEFQVFTVAADAEDVEVSRAVATLKPEYTIENCPKPDIVVIPGGNVGAISNNAKMMEWIKARAVDTEVLMSVCNGAFVLADAGLLDGVEATTHHGAIEHFKRTATKTKVVADRRFVDNGKIITAAGVSAGIDASLHVVERLLGSEAADNTAKYMEHARQPQRLPTGN